MNKIPYFNEMVESFLSKTTNQETINNIVVYNYLLQSFSNLDLSFKCLITKDTRWIRIKTVGFLFLIELNNERTTHNIKLNAQEFVLFNKQIIDLIIDDYNKGIEFNKNYFLNLILKIKAKPKHLKKVSKETLESKKDNLINSIILEESVNKSSDKIQNDIFNNFFANQNKQKYRCLFLNKFQKEKINSLLNQHKDYIELSGMQVIKNNINKEFYSVNYYGFVYELLVIDFIRRNLNILSFDTNKQISNLENFDALFINNNVKYGFEISTASLLQKENSANKPRGFSTKLQQFNRRKKLQDVHNDGSSLKSIYITNEDYFSRCELNFRLIFDGNFNIVKNEDYYKFIILMEEISKVKTEEVKQISEFVEVSSIPEYFELEVENNNSIIESDLNHLTKSYEKYLDIYSSIFKLNKTIFEIFFK